MDLIHKSYIGLAGEFRVMSELLLRGHNPSKSYLDNGIDLILENGKKIQVKSSYGTIDGQKTKKKRYRFYFEKKQYKDHKKKTISESVDFLILWRIIDDIFYIIPKHAIGNKKNACMVINREKGKGWYDEYIEKWDLLLQG